MYSNCIKASGSRLAAGIVAETKRKQRYTFDIWYHFYVSHIYVQNGINPTIWEILHIDRDVHHVRIYVCIWVCECVCVCLLNTNIPTLAESMVHPFLPNICSSISNSKNSMFYITKGLRIFQNIQYVDVRR